ncbi:MAG: TIGR03960 family B12-binding radical SAM protein [Nitrospirae bacterium]|nr:TIGR03960 family B12-binding radical SAM protein [Nitrospirota bacterium]
MPNKTLLEILPLVAKPSRYIGAEINSIKKDPAGVSLRAALCFPDVYEVGISHLGLKVLYEALNRRPDIYAERAYSPWMDLEEKLRENGIPLSTVETLTPLGQMDVVGFTLQYELSYTNILNMLDLAGIPVRSAERDDSHPLIIAGGPCAFNPEPLAEYIDAFVIGDAEEAMLDVADAVIAHKASGVKDERAALLLALSKIPGVYVPAHFEVTRDADGRLTGIKNIAGGPEMVTKRTLRELDDAPYPAKPILPYIAAVHNRVTLEVARGCPRGCRFCQAGYVYRPMRERAVDDVLRIAEDSICSTGFEEMSLASLSTGDYSGLLPLMKGLMDRYEGRRVSISLPSLRVGTLTPEMCREIKRVRKSGFTIAPEAGTQRLRDVINKNVTEEGLIETAHTVFSEGWDLIKLYFMTGLPTETDEDIEGIINLSRKVLDEGKKSGGGRRKGVNVGVSAFVPKPHTPFQWQGQIPLAEIRRKKDRLSGVLGRKPFAMKSGFAEMSVLEAAFARGGRELGAALYNAWKAGARFDGWTECFNYRLWTEAFASAGLDLHAEAEKSYSLDDVLPWDHIGSGVTKAYLKKEYMKAMEGTVSPDCRTKCTSCGMKCVEEEYGPYRKTPMKAVEPLPPVEPARPRPAVSARVRIKYSKLSPLNLLSHTELMIVFFRAISRAGLPIMFSEGFNPHPKVSFGPALAVGIESEAESLDIELGYAIDLKLVVKALSAALPDGIRIIEARTLRAGEPAAGVGATRYTYEAVVPERLRSDAAGLVAAFLAKESAVITRVSDKGSKELDIRPMVGEAILFDDGMMRFTIVEKDGRSAKPFEAVQAIFGLTAQESRAVRVKRTRVE